MSARSRLLVGISFLLALLLYVPRTCRTVAAFGDSAELLTAAAVWGVPHPPGYPLYTSLAHLFTYLPWFELPFRVHLTSALFRAATVAMVALSIDEVTGSWPAAIIGAGSLALSRIFFTSALYAEVFPLADLLFAAALLLGIRIACAERRTGDVSLPFSSFAVAVGFSLAHHPMAVLSLPALAILVERPLRRHVAARPAAAASLLGFISLPLVASYALLPLAAARHPYLSWGDVHDFRSWFQLVSRQDYGGPFHASRRAVDGQLLERIDAFAGATATSFGVVALLLAAFGAGVGWARERRLAAALLLAVLVSGPVFGAMNAIDLHSAYRLAYFERFATMCQVPLAVLVGWGAAVVAERWAVTRVRAIIAPAVAAAAIGPLVPNVRALDMSRDRLGIVYAHDLILSTPEDSLVLLKGDMPGQAALYLCAVERACGRRIIFSPGQFFMRWKFEELTRRHPDLPWGSFDQGWQETVRRLVSREMGHRPIFVYPELLDDVKSAAEAVLPAGLLFRLYPDDDAVRADVGRFRDEIIDIARGERCQGCLARRLGSGLALEVQLVQAYKSALASTVAAARELGLAAEGDAIAATMIDQVH